MADETKTAKPAEKATPEKKASAPVTRVKSAGRINQKLTYLAQMYEKNNPGREVRMIYDPKHKPDLSNVLSRQVDGYQLVYVKELGDAVVLPGMKPDEPVRVGDSVMMSIAAADRSVLREERDRHAAEELTRVEQEYNASIEEISHVKGGKAYSPRPMGRSIIEEVEKDVDGPESHSGA